MTDNSYSLTPVNEFTRRHGTLMAQKYPKAVVFDLDYTLWPCWCDTHISTPLKSLSNETVVDRYGYELSFYKDVGAIFEDLLANGVVIISASRTSAPSVARKLLKLLHLIGKPAMEHFDHMEWGTFSKKKHISSALQMYPEIEFTDLILYDDEMRNRDVEQLGCVFAHVPNEQHGLTMSVYKRGLTEWRKRQANA